MNVSRRHLQLALLSAAMGGTLPVGAASQRPLRILIGFTAGGPPDVALRQIAGQLRTSRGTPVVVENLVGASGTIAGRVVARAEGDGSTLMFGTAANLAIAPWLVHPVPYDPATDFAPVAEVARGPFVWLVRADAPARSMPEFVDWARREPGRLNFGTPGTGSAHHLATELLMLATGMRLQHVPYRTPLNPALLSGEVQAMYQSLPSPLPLIESGRFRALAVSGGRRLPLLLNVPTLQEQGVGGADAESWWGFVAPASAPAALVDALNAEIHAAVRDSGLAALLASWGMEPIPSGAAAFGLSMRQESARWRSLIRTLGLKPS